MRASQAGNSLDGSVTNDGKACHLVKQTIYETLEELVPTSRMPIDQGRPDAELLGKAAHRKAGHSVALNEARRGVEDRLGVDGHAGDQRPVAARRDARPSGR